MFTIYQDNSAYRGGINIAEHVSFLLEIKDKSDKISLELRPMQLILIQGCIQLIRAYIDFPEQYDSELSIASKQIIESLKMAGFKLPERDIPESYFAPIIHLLGDIQLVEISDDDEEDEEISL